MKFQKIFLHYIISSNSKNLNLLVDNQITGDFPDGVDDDIKIVGIHNYNAKGYHMINNVVTAKQNTSDVTGILTQFANGTPMIENKVFSNLSTGISLFNLMDGVLCGNIAEGTKVGLNVTLACNRTVIKESQFNNNSSKAIKLDGFGISLGPQEHFGNGFKASDAIHTEPLDAHYSRFIVNNDLSQSCSKTEYMPRSISPINNWFIKMAGCERFCQSALQSASELSESETDVVNDQILALGYSNTQIWEAKYNLFERLSRNPELKTTSNIHQFYETVNDSNIGVFYQVEKGIEQAFSYDDTNELFKNRDNLSAIAANKYSIWIADTTNINAWGDYENTLEQLQNAQEATNQLMGEFIQNRDNILAQVNTLNNGTITSESMESDLKIVNKLRIKYYVEHSLTDEEWNILKQIAANCPINSGRASSNAKGLLYAEHKNNDISIDCGSVIIGKIQSTKKEKVSIFPNPVSSELNVQFPNNISSRSKITAIIFDVSGKPISNFELDKSTTNILDVSNYKSGFYIINLLENGLLISVERFIKIN